jgi:hypothetical protein
MVLDDERDLMVLCDCPSGDGKRRLLSQTPEERRRERKAGERKKKAAKEELERSWVKEGANQ